MTFSQSPFPARPTTIKLWGVQNSRTAATIREGLHRYAEAKDAQRDEEAFPPDRQRARKTPARRHKPFTDPDIKKAAQKPSWHHGCPRDDGGQCAPRSGWEQQLS